MRIVLNNQQQTLSLEPAQFEQVTAQILEDAGFTDGTLSIAVVDDPTIHALNVKFLEHDYPTDVLSFALEQRDHYLDGEVIVSADTASANAADYGWPAKHELLLYVIHGTLHLVGYRDKSDSETAAMRAAEAKYLAAAGITLPATPATLATDRTTEGATTR